MIRTHRTHEHALVVGLGTQMRYSNTVSMSREWRMMSAIRTHLLMDVISSVTVWSSLSVTLSLAYAASRRWSQYSDEIDRHRVTSDSSECWLVLSSVQILESARSMTDAISDMGSTCASVCFVALGLMLSISISESLWRSTMRVIHTHSPMHAYGSCCICAMLMRRLEWWWWGWCCSDDDDDDDSDVDSDLVSLFACSLCIWMLDGPLSFATCWFELLTNDVDWLMLDRFRWHIYSIRCDSVCLPL